ncbi:MAG TPA: restriction endonuclease, partial [Chloroflexota bacterium]|nr:restriction endonuclease [Chloroflexota bacterium]
AAGTGMLLPQQAAQEAMPPPLQISQISKTSMPPPHEFVAQVCNLFMQRGYQVSTTNDGGNTLLLTKSGKQAIATYLWQEGMVGPESVQPFLQLMTTWEASHGYFVTTGAFTLQVEDMVAGKPVQLIDGREFAELLKIEAARSGEATAGANGHDPHNGLATASLQGATMALNDGAAHRDGGQAAAESQQAAPATVSLHAATTVLEPEPPAEERDQE